MNPIEVVDAVGLAPLFPEQGIALAGGRHHGHGAEPGGEIPLQLVVEGVLQPFVGTGEVLGLAVHHAGVGPAGDPFLGHGSGDGLLVGDQGIGLERPGAGGHHPLVLEIIYLDKGVVPVASHQLALLAQQIEGGLVLLLVQFVGILDAERGLVAHQIEGGIGDVDGAVECLHPPLVGLAVRQGLLLEHHAPGVGRLGEHLGVVHQDVAAPLVGHAIVLAVHRVPGGILQAGVYLAVARDERQVECLHLAAGDEAQAGVAGGGHQIEAPLVHQRHHLVRGGGRLDVDLAAGLFLEAGDPVVVLVGLAALHVAGPGHDVELAFTLAEGGGGSLDLACQQGGDQGQGEGGQFHLALLAGAGTVVMPR